MMKISNLKKGVVGVCAATMLTGLCAVPAFAAATDQSDETPVTLDTGAINISVTIPTTPVLAAVDASGAFSNVSGGKIVNNSVCGVHVSSISVAKTAGSSMTLQDATAFDAEGNSTANVAKLNAKVGSVDLDVADFDTPKAPTSDIKLATSAEANIVLSGAVKNLTGATMNENALSFVSITWTVAADA